VVTLGPVILEFPLLIITPFAAIRQKLAYHAKYLRISWTYLDLLYRFGSDIGGDDYPDIHLTVAQGTLLWQSVKLGDVCRRRMERPLLFDSLVWRSTTDSLIVKPLSKG